MARPIKTIPVLRGEDSRHFNKTLKQFENQRVSNSDYNAICDVVNAVMASNPHMDTGKRMKKR